MNTFTCDPRASNAESAASAPKRGIWTLMWPVRRRIHLAMGLAALGAVSGLGAVAVLAVIIAQLLGPAPSPWPWAVLAVLLTGLGFFLRNQAFTASHMAAFDLETILRTDLAERMARVPLGYLLQIGTGALTKVMQDDVKSLHAFVADTTPMIGRSVATPLATLVLMLIIDWRLAMLALGLLAVGILAMRLAMRDHVKLQRSYDGERERINNAVIEFVQAMPVVRTFDDGASSFGRYQKALDGFRDVLAKWLEVSAVSAKISILILGPLPTLLALTLGGVLLFTGGSLDFPDWAAALLLGTGMAESLMPLMWINHFIRKASASALRIQKMQAAPVLPVSMGNRKPRDASVSFEQVRFAYKGRTDNALDDVSFHVPAGSITALVGPSGAGKTTVARLIPRFWDVADGSVRVGDADVRDIRPEDLMRHVSFVFQDTFLFNDTIAANIRLGRSEATDAEVENAARAAQAHDFIAVLPQGYDTPAGDRGVRLSGGQRQRITIARAILQNCPVVVLDEATAFADPENEAALIAALANLMRGRTVLIIAHRLSTIRDADQIVVLDQGQAAEQGRHDDLIAANGVYARLWQSYEQAQGWTLGATTQPGPDEEPA